MVTMVWVLVEIRFKAPLALQIHLSFHHHSHRDNVTAPTGRPNFRSRLHFSHSRGGGPRSRRGHVVALGGRGNIYIYIYIYIYILCRCVLHGIIF